MAINFPTRVMQRIKRKQIKNSVTGWLFASLFIALSFCASASELNDFDARYKAYRYGKELGEANITLSSLGRDRYRLHYQSKLSLFLVSDKRQETSLFSFDGQHLQPYKYEYKRTGTIGSDKNLTATFDEKKSLVHIGKDTLPWQGELDNQLYRLDLQLKLAQGEKKFTYDIVNNRGQIRSYEMQVLGTEQLQLPYGMLEGIKVKIMRDNNKRETFVWFSPQLNYQLVRLQQFKDGEEQGDIQLSAFSRSTTEVLTRR